MKHAFAIALALLAVGWTGTEVWAVGELLGLHVEVSLADGSVVRGRVVEETETSLTLANDTGRRAVQRSDIASIRLLEGDEPAVERAPETSPFAEVRRQAMRQAALWKLKSDGVEAARSLLDSLFAAALPTYRWDLVAASAGVGFGGWVLDFALKPSVEARLLWQSETPFWYGLLELGDGLAGLGAGVSLAIGFIQENVDAGLGSSREWFARSSALFLLSAGFNGLQLLYDAAVLAAPAAE